MAIDDFGTGYSSLSYLRRLPIDIVKIDRSFVTDLDDARTDAIARSIVGLASTLGLDCIAEGVETRAQAVSVEGLGCRLAQGLWYGRPTDAAVCLSAPRPREGS